MFDASPIATMITKSPFGDLNQPVTPPFFANAMAPAPASASVVAVPERSAAPDVLCDWRRSETPSVSERWRVEKEEDGRHVGVVVEVRIGRVVVERRQFECIGIDEVVFFTV